MHGVHGVSCRLCCSMMYTHIMLLSDVEVVHVLHDATSASQREEPRAACSSSCKRIVRKAWRNALLKTLRKASLRMCLVWLCIQSETHK